MAAGRGGAAACACPRCAAAGELHAGAPNGDGLAELVCSNSFRSDDADGECGGPAASGDAARSARSSCAQGDRASRARGVSALAVDPRRLFGRGSPPALADHPNVTFVRERVDALAGGARDPRDRAADRAGVCAAAVSAAAKPAADALAFFDALAPIVHRDTIDMDVIAWLPVALGQGATAPITSTARWTRSSISPSSPRCWPARRPSIK